MDKFTSVPEIEGLFWHFENGVSEPLPVLINRAKWGRKFKSLNGAEQSRLRDGEYLVGPQPTPAA
ncbi:TPA: hypothetical protein L4592_006128 [Pseudomonas aeruginosa]|uniref:hypothetical protein n=1 Tax=Pseudomonas aeruginosa TaxID=287 RepID=UPI001A2271B6|nr:hypothetical protein [Pseudomonas aeruginosa]MBH8788194.1 hypothetical protein [Pseudomonas aeruginosa]MCV0035773.1 hypothetical protein [Pseudomonas aeruginosa]MDY1119362.1 hypothetical protein [Pseudomonas aeruginosa]HBO5661730.1 hypothetical protein [Pseudomonas aeruginosa]HBO5664130.1 hypothetical protein [Pseudomonas aeruginosa]